MFFFWVKHPSLKISRYATVYVNQSNDLLVLVVAVATGHGEVEDHVHQDAVAGDDCAREVVVEQLCVAEDICDNCDNVTM
jgi:hypothetical protein